MSLAKPVFAAAFAALTLMAACSGGQGDTCSTDSDCGANLMCQPIKGRTKNYCCPTPAESSDYSNCHADTSAEAAQQSTSTKGDGG